MNDEESSDITNVFTFLSVDEEEEENEVIDIENSSDIPEFQAHLSAEENRENKETEGQEEEDTKDAEDGAFSDIRIAMVGNVDSGKVRFSLFLCFLFLFSFLLLFFSFYRSLPESLVHSDRCTDNFTIR